MAQAAAVLPESMQVPASATTGTPRVSRRGRGIELGRAHARRDADALAEVREMQHRAEHLAVERLADIRVGGIADAEHAADVQELHDRADLERFGKMSGVAEQRLAVAERADDDVALVDRRHPAAVSSSWL